MTEGEAICRETLRTSFFGKVHPKIQELAHICETNTAIDKELYTKYEVKRGLRDLNGKGLYLQV